MLRHILLTLALLPALVTAAEPTVTHIDYRFISKQLVARSFEASVRRMWRAGDSYLRVEEPPDPSQNIHGVLISNAPHSWLWNRYGNTARHVIDPGPTFDVIVPVFPWVTSQELQKLQMGRELDYFRENKASRLPDDSVEGIAVSAQRLAFDGYTVTLFTRKSNGMPYQLVLSDPKEPYTVRYEVFEEGLPFDRTLFVLPPDVKVVESE